MPVPTDASRDERGRAVSHTSLQSPAERRSWRAYVRRPNQHRCTTQTPRPHHEAAPEARPSRTSLVEGLPLIRARPARQLRARPDGYVFLDADVGRNSAFFRSHRQQRQLRAPRKQALLGITPSQNPKTAASTWSSSHIPGVRARSGRAGRHWTGRRDASNVCSTPFDHPVPAYTRQLGIQSASRSCSA
jgi:hypothetical protein